MNHILINTIAVGVVLGAIVFVHELGHFVAAKAFGVRVEVFSLGFGRRLTGFRRGLTDYRISALPLGGYVKMAGENPVDERAGLPDEFLSKPRWQRFVIAIAGPFMNVVLAVGLLVPVYMRHFERDSFLDQPAVVAAVDPDSAAAHAGLQPLDRIVSVDGVNNPTWEQVGMRAALSVDHPMPLTVQRQGKQIATSLTPHANSANESPTLGMEPVEDAIVDSVEPGTPAASAGLEPGDHLVALNGEPVLNSADAITRIQATQPTWTAAGVAGNPVHLTLTRNGQPVNLTITPRAGVSGGEHRWLMGVSIVGFVTVHLPFHEALRHSLADNRQFGGLILDLVGRLVSHRASISTLQGPIGIASMTGDAARQSSLLPLLYITSVISLNLGILNLLPIPVLDGGMILFLFIETLLRHEISLRIKERVYQAGFAFLLVLMTVVVYNDIVRAVVTHH